MVLSTLLEVLRIVGPFVMPYALEAFISREDDFHAIALNSSVFFALLGLPLGVLTIMTFLGFALCTKGQTARLAWIGLALWVTTVASRMTSSFLFVDDPSVFATVVAYAIGVLQYLERAIILMLLSRMVAWLARDIIVLIRWTWGVFALSTVTGLALTALIDLGLVAASSLLSLIPLAAQVVLVAFIAVVAGRLFLRIRQGTA